MKTKKQLSPSATDASSNPTTPKKVNKKSKLPTKDNDFGNLCTKVNEKWKTMPTLTLMYITQAQYQTKAALFNSTLATRQLAGASRTPLTTQLKNKDAEIDKAISGVKGYLKEKYEADSINYYGLFAIEKSGTTYVLAADRSKRKDAIDVIIAAIAKEGFGDKKYGSAYWSQLKIDYTAMLKLAGETDGKISSNVGNKDVLKDELTEVLDSIIFLVKANYPKTWDTELRNWGFTKENF